MSTQIQIRRDAAANWTSVNPTLAQGELGIETDTRRIKIGNGSATWNNLAYAAGGDGSIPTNNQTTTYTLVFTDIGKLINITTGGVTVPSSVFNVGDTISIYNNSTSDQTITQASGVTLRLAGTATTGNRTLAQYGIASVLCVASNVFVITGVGIS